MGFGSSNIDECIVAEVVVGLLLALETVVGVFHSLF